MPSAVTVRRRTEMRAAAAAAAHAEEGRAVEWLAGQFIPPGFLFARELPEDLLLKALPGLLDL